MSEIYLDILFKFFKLQPFFVKEIKNQSIKIFRMFLIE
jgi:hypothetical protein